MGIFKKIFTDQFFKISFVYCLFQVFKNCKLLYLCKGISFFIQPVSQNIQTVHQSFWIREKISFTITEFKVIDSSLYSFLINSILNNISQYLSDHRYEFFFSVRIGTFCNYCKIWLENTIIIRSIDILACFYIQKCLL